MSVLARALILTTLCAPAIASERREADAHLHGHSQLTIAIDQQMLEIEFEAPGMDLVGFEHAPETEEQRRQIVAATQRLNDPLAVFGIPSAANCTVTSQVVHSPADSDGKGHDHDKAHDHQAAEEHSEFHAVYQLKCTAMNQLSAINPTIFGHFPGMQVMAVRYATARGQGTLDISASNPRVTLP